MIEIEPKKSEVKMRLKWKQATSWHPPAWRDRMKTTTTTTTASTATTTSASTATTTTAAAAGPEGY